MVSVIRPVDGKESCTPFMSIATSTKAALTGTIGQVTVSPLPYPLRLTGTGVVLREWRWEDLDDLVALLDEPGIARWTLMPSPFDVEAGLAYLRRAQQGRIGGSRIQLAITTDGGRPLGEVLLFNVRPEAPEAELGYLIGLPYRRRGLASAALSLLSTYAFDTLALRRLLLRIDRGNTASTSVARRCGYRPAAEPPIQQDGPYGPATLDTWEYVENRSAPQDDRRKNVASRRYGRR
ncbi:RimJ/RimL family protein N-acetyltransferase [Actinoplanes xinjiangensis]|jgi:RimJ/RimL family protein N-acetyltransferase|uniref:RimJ/RimL family protein N-acetyltransferase n=1 Tax=Actinoplanes xinjiangensis TaxID=512350 RepID=A0A316F6G8_9ACTN|nr:RimJ/RimL family protein N-acetyltransferase [Actinoplanes xinjiangensis]